MIVNRPKIGPKRHTLVVRCISRIIVGIDFFLFVSSTRFMAGIPSVLHLWSSELRTLGSLFPSRFGTIY